MFTITKKLLNMPTLGLVRQEIDAFLDEEKIKRQQFYEDISEKDKAEFINGQVIMHSPVRKWHHNAAFNLSILLKLHVARFSLGFVGYEKIMVEFSRNSYEPDVCYFNQEKSDKFIDEQMIFPVPDFVVEVLSKTTEAIDRNIKFKDYASHGVGEYWIVSPKKKVIEKYICENAKYKLVEIYTKNDAISSEVVPGFEIAVNLLFDEQAFNKFTEKDKVQVIELKKEMLQYRANIEERDKLLQERLKTIEEKDKTIEEKDKMIDEKTKTIEEKDKTIARLLSEIEKQKKL